MRKIILFPILLYLLLLVYVQYVKNGQHKANKPTAISNEQLIKQYVDSFNLIAIGEMKSSGIPASIKLAQAILESQYGQSELAKYANNHFGIKCGDEWEGNKYCKYSLEWIDKLKGLKLGCFRSYNSVKESFQAHSDFLKLRSYYKELFQLDSNDYQSWAKGLQEAGYATDPEYANKLISLIRRYRLYQYDHATLPAIDTNRTKL